MPPTLRHLHIPGIVRYQHVSTIQESLVQQFLSWKAAPNSLPQPPPTIITAQFHPVYTCGRREVGKVSSAQKKYITAPVKLTASSEPVRADFVEALRGGQTTFHGPGQLVAYPVLDLRSHSLTSRSYVCLLEKSLIATCARYKINAMTTEHTGVWTTPEKKIAAIGVHLRRHVSSHGIGLNVSTGLGWFERIVACGLEGKKTTSFENEGVSGVSVNRVGEDFVELVAEGLAIDSGAIVRTEETA